MKSSGGSSETGESLCHMKAMSAWLSSSHRAVLLVVLVVVGVKEVEHTGDEGGLAGLRWSEDYVQSRLERKLTAFAEPTDPLEHEFHYVHELTPCPAG